MAEVHEDGSSRARQMLAIFLVSMAGLLLEVGYTRIVSYKLWYYYTYLVIGLALLGIGSGGIFVVLFKRLRETTTERLIAICSIFGAISIAIGYLIISRIPVDTLSIWDYGTKASFKNLAIIGVICFTVFASFIALGIIVSTILGRAPEGRIGRLYFADLIGAGLGCLAAIPLITALSPPDVIMVSALIFAGTGLIMAPKKVGILTGIGAVAGIVLLLIVVGVVSLPDVRTEDTKNGPDNAAFSEWGPVFRVDVLFVPPPDARPGEEAALLLHDGTFGSAMHKFDGDFKALTRYDSDPRALPFAVLDQDPERELIIGSAAGNEILASKHFGAKKIEGVELNPVTLSLLTDHYKKYSGDLEHQPGVSLHNADGRTYLARSDKDYDLIWYVAPDSYAANNAASAGAFVLSESYLYTKEMIADSLQHLSDDGLMVVQFGELNFTDAPNRTARYVMTARAAMESIGIKNPGDHMIVSAFITNKTGDLSTIILKRTPFTPAEVARYEAAVPKIPQAHEVWAPGGTNNMDHLVTRLASATSSAQADKFASEYPRDISAVTDDAPFFWHFRSFGDVIRNITHPLTAQDPEDSVGERVLLLLLGVSVLYAAIFLLAPFFFVRKEWRSLPGKGMSAVYFAALGLGFMFYEITMIQRLVRFLGYPTLSLTVTLASILVFTGFGALASKRFADKTWLMPVLLVILAAITLFYEFGLENLSENLLDQSFSVRVIVSLIVLAPLGLCLGMFMPLGLGMVSQLSSHGDEYVAWSWAINGFFSVIGSVLTTILSMTFGFSVVQFLALGVYAIAALAFTRLSRRARRAKPAMVAPPESSFDPPPTMEPVAT
jgi:spermidine synthase